MQDRGVSRSSFGRKYTRSFAFPSGVWKRPSEDGSDFSSFAEKTLAGYSTLVPVSE